MSICSPPKSDNCVMAQILFEGLLDHLNGVRGEYSGIYALNVGRMLDWMAVGGYSMYNCEGERTEELNEKCLAVLKEMNLDPRELKEQISLFIKDSPFTLEDSEIETIKKFLATMIERLDKDK